MRKKRIYIVYLPLKKNSIDTILEMRILSNLKDNKHFKNFDIKLLSILLINKNELNEGDVYLFYKGQIFFRSITFLIDYLHSKNKLLVYDIDDYILDVPDYSGSSSKGTKSIKSLDIFFNNLKKFDLITTTTIYLKNKLSQYNKNVQILENSVECSDTQSINQENGDTINILLSSSDNLKLHNFKDNFLKVLKDIKIKYGKRIKIVLQGSFQNIKNCEQIADKVYGRMRLNEYNEFLRENNFHIGLAPLGGREDPETLEMHSCKSNIKFIEFACNGISGIYSDVEPYSDIINEKEGLIVKNTYYEWFNAVSRLVENKLLREKITGNSKKKVNEKYAKDKIRKNYFLLISNLFHKDAVNSKNINSGLYLLIKIRFYSCVDLLILKIKYAITLIRNGNYMDLIVKSTKMISGK